MRELGLNQQTVDMLNHVAVLFSVTVMVLAALYFGVFSEPPECPDTCPVEQTDE